MNEKRSDVMSAPEVKAIVSKVLQSSKTIMSINDGTM